MKESPASPERIGVLNDFRSPPPSEPVSRWPGTPAGRGFAECPLPSRSKPAKASEALRPKAAAEPRSVRPVGSGSSASLRDLVGAAGAAYCAASDPLQAYMRSAPADRCSALRRTAVGGDRLPASTPGPHQVTRRWDDWLLAFCGTFGGVLFRPVGAHPQWGLDGGLGVQLLGLAICVWSFLALGRSFGFAAADRGLVQRGPYAIVRHPIYASYVLLQAGYLMQSISIRNALVMMLVTGCNVGRAALRMRPCWPRANRTISYRARVRWTFVPGLW